MNFSTAAALIANDAIPVVAVDIALVVVIIVVVLLIRPFHGAGST
jgi:hypothetical protein